MKKFLQYLLLFFLLSFLGIILTNQDYFRESFQDITGINKPCSKPIEYSIGEIDPRFGISRDILINDAGQAENIWEKSSGNNLFEYNPGAELKINLVFDERQQQTNEAELMEKNLEKMDSAHNLTIQEYNSLSSSYKKQLAEYNSDVDKYEKRLKAYNDEVKYWNSQGGASKDKYENLKEEKEALEKMYNNLEEERDNLNSLAKKTNQAARKENEIVDKYNASIETYKNKFGASREFEKGIYDGTAINIYEFKENDDLKMTIIHEFGHALGIGHLNNAESIMYYLLGEQDLQSPKLSEEDITALKNTCRIK